MKTTGRNYFKLRNVSFCETH